MTMTSCGLPKEEQEFTALLENWYVNQGVPREYALFSCWVEAEGAATYRAGERIARELSQLQSLVGRTVLDVGCGFGGAVVALPRFGARCIGVDMSLNELALCRKRLELHGCDSDILRGDAFGLPFRTESFDIVICTEVLEHIRDKSGLIAELSRVLKKGGLLYLSFPNFMSLRNMIRDPHYHLPGATLLPLSIARWYTRKVRGRNYDVEMLPIPSLVSRICAREGVVVYCVNASEEVLLRKIDSPESIENRFLRLVISIFKALRLQGLFKLIVKIRANTMPNSILAGFKA